MKNDSGFTFMELMVVIAIIGIISAIAVPNVIAWRANYQLNGSAREVMSFLNGARLDAVKNNARVDITIDAGNRRVVSQFTNRATGVVPLPKFIDLRPGINIEATTFAGDAFSFNSRGLPTNPGTITLRKTGGDARDVVMAITGITRIE